MKFPVYGIVLCLYLTVFFEAGCGVKGVKTGVTSEKKIGLIEDIDPFAIGDEFAMIKQSQVKNHLEAMPQASPEKSRLSQKLVEVPENQGISDTLNKRSESFDTTTEVMGFRINIGIFDKESEAKEFAKTTELKIDEKVYIVYETPFFKVRVGDFTKLKDAEEYVKYLKSIGLKSSWWIRTTINTQ